MLQVKDSVVIDKIEKCDEDGFTERNRIRT